MRSARRRRLALVGVLLIVGALACGAVAALDVQKVFQGSNEGLISLVKLPQTAAPTTQRAEQQANYDALEKTLIDIASNNSTVQNITTGKNYTVVGIRVDKGGPSQESYDVETAQLAIKVDGTFHVIVEDVQQKQVTAVEKRACYGPRCNS
jgi:hypothetical protein